MKTVKMFEKYYKRVAREGKIKATVLGLIIGFSAMFVTATLLWVFNPDLFWLSLIPLAVGAGVSIPLFYRFIFKPTSNTVAARIDELGLEERVITMNEHMDDDSYIAKRQREDTVKSLGSVNADLIKIVVSVPLIIVACLAAALGTGMTTVGALAKAGIIDSGKGIIDDNTAKEPTYYEIEYEAYGEGHIEGDFLQRIEEGKDATEVYAVAEDEYVFVGWYANGVLVSQDPYRKDTKIEADEKYTARFEQAQDGEGEGGEGDGDGGEGDEGDSARPNDGDGSSDNNGDSGNTPGGSTPGGEYQSNDQVIDGKQDYKDYYDEAKSEATENARDNGNYTDEDRDAIDGYFNIIKK